MKYQVEKMKIHLVGLFIDCLFVVTIIQLAECKYAIHDGKNYKHKALYGDENIQETVPVSNQELIYMIQSLPDVSNNQMCLETEECAQYWLDAYNQVLDKIGERGSYLQYLFTVNITDYNEQQLVEYAPIENKFLKFVKPIIKKFLENCKSWNPELKRQLYLASLGLTFSDEDSTYLANLSNQLESIYARAQVCENDDKTKCLSLEPEITELMSTSRNYSQLLWAWQGWHNEAGRKMRKIFAETVVIQNKGARDNGYADLSENWILDFEDENFEQIMDNLFEEIKPLYELLHAYVRRILENYYRTDLENQSKSHDTKLIQAHLLGNMWAQEWINIYDLVKPYPNVKDIDIEDYFKEMNYKPIDFFKDAEKFFTSMGLFEMTPAFWKHSMIEKPANRSVQCHASAFDFSNHYDFRIKMCTSINTEDYITVHHEMGHIEYYMAYRDQKPLFRAGANSGFHEAIGDTISLSVMTPKHLKTMGILEDDATSYEQDINYLMKFALKKIAFLPFGYLMDKWRWNVFRGTINESNYNEAWWQMRREYQGIESPVERDENDFDPGAKYHIASYTPYARYFVSHLHQFQFFKALCDLSGHEGELFKCDFYNSLEAGEKLKKMLSLGTSHHWKYALSMLTGEKKMSIKPLLEYFEPLIKWLEMDNFNNDVKPGW